MYPNSMKFPVQNLLLGLLLITSLSPSASAETREKQIQVETKLVEVSHSNTRDLGVDWTGREQRELGQDRGLQHLGQTGNLPQTKSIFDFKPLDFNPPQPQTKPAIAPIIPAPNNQPAASIVHSGVKLNVAPEIDEKGNVKMTLKPEVSEFNFNPANPQLGNQILFLNGQSLIIGGLVQEPPAQKKDKAPVVGEIPVIGKLFHGQTDNSNKKDLMVFITPTIVDSHSE